jgi:hypothetical protein
MMGGMGTSADAAGSPDGPWLALCLPQPAGPYPAGTTSLWLTDTSRRDPWAADVAARELMVSLFMVRGARLAGAPSAMTPQRM